MFDPSELIRLDGLVHGIALDLAETKKAEDDEHRLMFLANAQRHIEKAIGLTQKWLSEVEQLETELLAGIPDSHTDWANTQYRDDSAQRRYEQRERSWEQDPSWAR